MIHIKSLLFGALTLLFSVIVYAMIRTALALSGLRCAAPPASGAAVGLDLSVLMEGPWSWLVALSGFAAGFVWMLRVKSAPPTPVGAALGASALLVSVLGVVWASGYFQAFAENRGLLQLVVAIPAALLVTSGGLAFSRVLTRAELLWALLPVGVLIFLGTEALGLDHRAWPWALAVSAVVSIPWVAGLLLGAAARRPGSPGAPAAGDAE